MSKPIVPAMTESVLEGVSETEETVLDLVQGALKIFHDIAAVDIGESEADEDHFRNSSRTYALAGPVTVGDIRKAALAYEQLAAFSRAPEALEPGDLRFVWSNVVPGDMDYWEAVFGFNGKERAEAFRQRITALALSPPSTEGPDQ